MGFSFSVNIVSVLPERHTSVVGHSNCGAGVLVGNGCVVEYNCRLCRTFLVGVASYDATKVSTVCVE